MRALGNLLQPVQGKKQIGISKGDNNESHSEKIRGGASDLVGRE